MNKFIFVIVCFISFPAIAQEHKIIPAPVHVEKREDNFKWTDYPIPIIADETLFFEAEYLSKLLKKEHGIVSEIVSMKNEGSRIQLLLDGDMNDAEAYALEITEKQIIITGGSPSGVFYGIQSLRQWMWNNYDDCNKVVSDVLIKDQPRYPYRALMLDPARHFLPVNDLKRYVDVMAQYKFNRLHLHLSDDQGWRIEIKKYPKLMEIGSVRSETDGDGKPHSGFYTQQDMKALVAYAAQRHVSIIPEIDIPGHSVAAIASYPYLTCFEGQLEVRTTPGVSKDLLCGGNDEVFRFLDDVIDELAQVFPGEEFHIGGDEAPLDHWKKCPKCQKRMKELKLSSPQHLMSYFFQRVNESLQKHKKKPLVWYELDVPYYPENSIMYAWRLGLSKEVIEKSRKQGYQLVCCPGEHAYFDYPQAKGEETCNWMPVLPLEQVYKFEPTMELPAKETNHIIGVEATLWGEYIKDINRAFYMTWPRAMALSEVGWSEKKNRSWNDFKGKMDVHTSKLLHQAVYYRPPVEIYDL